MPLLIGIDAGSTVTKTVVFDLTGEVVATASQRVALQYPRPRHVERDQDQLWEAVCSVTRRALEGLDSSEVIGIGITSHGDGIYMVDADIRPTRPGIMSLDSRGEDVVHAWNARGVSDALFDITGQRPWASAPSVLLAWLAQHEPDVVVASAWALPAKDMLKARMTGEVSTEPTEASVSFTNVLTQEYDLAIFPLIGVPEAVRLLPPVVPSDAVAGTVTAQAAAAMGVPEGIPVAASAHDVDCSALGSGVARVGVASVVAGSFSINQVISQEPKTGQAWFARNFVLPGRWMNMSISPTSSANMEWFVQHLCAADVAAAPAGTDPLSFIDREVAAVMDDPSEVVFTPFLFGSLVGDGRPVRLNRVHDGLQRRGRGRHLQFARLRAGQVTGEVGDGDHLLGPGEQVAQLDIALGHQSHVAALASAFAFDRVRLTGGATKSNVWCQIFADAFGLPVEIPHHEESGAWGAALLAGVAVGAFPDVVSAAETSVQVARSYLPSAEGGARLDRRAWADLSGSAEL